VALRLRREHRASSPKLRHLWFHANLITKTDNFGDVTWLGYPVWQSVLDLWALQEVIVEIRPALLIETGTNHAGSALFYAHLFDLLGHGRVVTVDIESMHTVNHPRIEFLIGSSVSPEILALVRDVADAADGPVMVVLDSDHSATHVGAELEAYAPLVTPGSLLLCQDGIIDLLPKLAVGPGSAARDRSVPNQPPRVQPGPGVSQPVSCHPPSRGLASQSTIGTAIAARGRCYWRLGGMPHVVRRDLRRTRR
jgi:cephalosporin hydroxylase